MKENNLISIETANRVIKGLKSTFDSHDFIMALILSDTISYLGLLRHYHRVITANQKIGDFLQRNSNELGIMKIDDVNSENILGKPSQCGLWLKQQLL